MMAEFAAYYGGPAAPTLPWPLFLALVDRTGRFEARRQLTLFDSVGAAIGSAFGGDEIAAHRAREHLVARAYPVKRERQLIVRGDEAPADG